MISKPRVVAIGGGSGLSTVLRGLKNYPLSLAGIVAMTDNGASSGRLSRDLGVLPPGDVRKCLAALSNDEDLMTRLFEYRFSRGRNLAGHSLGNLFLLALNELTGGFEEAVQASGKILNIKGEVIPSTLKHVSLVAELKNGQQALGEAEIPIQGHRFGIKDILILPPNVAANPRAIHFIDGADIIIIGPGSLFTSISPSLLIPEIRQALARSTALKIYVVNVSTERGETEHFTVTDHIEVIQRYLGEVKLDWILANNQILVRSTNAGKLGSIVNIGTDEKIINQVKVRSADLIDEARPLYHDHKKLAAALWQLITKTG